MEDDELFERLKVLLGITSEESNLEEDFDRIKEVLDNIDLAMKEGREDIDDGVNKIPTASVLLGMKTSIDGTKSYTPLKATSGDRLPAVVYGRDGDDNIQSIRTNKEGRIELGANVELEDVDIGNVNLMNKADEEIDPATEPQQENIISELSHLRDAVLRTDDQPLDVSGAEVEIDITSLTYGTLPVEQQTPVELEDTGGTQIDPATETKQDDIITQISSVQERDITDRTARVLGQLTDGSVNIVPFRESEISYIEDYSTGNEVSLVLGDYRHKVDITVSGTGERDVTIEIYDGANWVHFSTETVTDDETIQVETVAEEIKAYASDDTDLDRLTIMSKGAL